MVDGQFVTKSAVNTMNDEITSSPNAGQPTTRSAAEIQDWLLDKLAEELETDRSQIQVKEPILAQGIDSMHVVAIVAQLEDWLGIRFSSNPLEDYPSIEALSQSLGANDERG
ncbi:Phosphopantetheine attachment site [Symmachiella macrocystis]|uniref:Phosphopantetheine attachment site n=2 Tax=Symmachiella macrocystis TaxID=2527985 RepID=A0A5C6BA17_9PLAN|nr:Phosphopantetheine attachment site [Symmachiella macrocystis]